MTKRKRSRKHHGGGFFYNTDHNASCNASNDVSTLTTSCDAYKTYEECCPKSMLGLKNRSPYCTKLHDRYKQLAKEEDAQDGTSKPWWKIWGGRKRNRISKSKSKSKKRNRSKHRKTRRK